MNTPEPAIHSAQISVMQEVAQDTFEVTFTLDGDFVFEAGQYVWVVLSKLLYEDPRGARRAFSICSAPSGSTFSIVFRRSASGFKRTFLELPSGSRVSIHGPFGSMRLLADGTQPVAMVAGGVGITPFLAMIRAAVAAKRVSPIILIYANTDRAHAAYLDELYALQSAHSFFTLLPVIGAVTREILTSVVPDLRTSGWYVAGPKPMVNTVGNYLRDAGVAERELVFDEFFATPGTSSEEFSSLATDIDAFRQAIEDSSSHIIFTDLAGIVTFANKGAEVITQFTRDEMVGQTPRLWGGLMGDAFYRSLWQTIKVERKPFVGEVRNRRKDGTLYDAVARISPVFGRDGEMLGFVGTEEDITKVKDLDRAKTEFLSIASHQLRTPLSAIKWTIELCMQDEGLTEKQKERLQDIYASNQRLIDLVNSLLSVARIEAGKIVADKKKADLVALIETARATLAPAANRRGQSIHVSVKDGVQEAIIDPMLCSQALNNLISNAINYAPSNSVIDVNLRVQDTMYVIAVHNNGPTIPVEEQQRLFGKFYRGDRAQSARTEGSGLGLFITRGAVEANGGTVGFESTPEKGTTFFFTVPRG